MQNYRSIITYGFAIFIMFFGSGNLVFPIQIGLNSGSNWIPAFFGLFITGILLPLMGLFVIKIYKGSFEDFFSEAGVIAKVLLPLFTLSLLGSFGVVPRCITVAHGGIAQVFPPISLPIFSLFFCIICFSMCIRDKAMISLLGKWLTPVLLLSLAVLIIAALGNGNDLPIASMMPREAFTMAFKTGYEIMDLFAAFFFSSVIFKQIQGGMKPGSTHKETIIVAAKSSIIGALLLSAAYLGFIYLGSHYANLISAAEPTLMLPIIATFLLGSNATFLIAVIFVLSCLTTAVALNNIYARYLCSLFKLKDKWFEYILFCTTSVSFAISLLDFKGIAKLLSPMLDITYPGIIALTFLSLMMRGGKLLKMFVFYSSIVLMLF